MEDEAVSSGPFAEILLDLNECAAAIDASDSNLFDRVSDAIANVVRAVLIAGIRGFRHQDAHVLGRDRRVGELQRNGAALRVLTAA